MFFCLCDNNVTEYFVVQNIPAMIGICLFHFWRSLLFSGFTELLQKHFIALVNHPGVPFLTPSLFTAITHPWASVLYHLKTAISGSPWVAQWFSACLPPRAWSWGPGIESHLGLPAWSLLLPLPVSLPLLLSVFQWINKILKKKKALPFPTPNFHSNYPGMLHTTTSDLPSLSAVVSV